MSWVIFFFSFQVFLKRIRSMSTKTRQQTILKSLTCKRSMETTFSISSIMCNSLFPSNEIFIVRRKQHKLVACRKNVHLTQDSERHAQMTAPRCKQATGRTPALHQFMTTIVSIIPQCPRSTGALTTSVSISALMRQQVCKNKHS